MNQSSSHSYEAPFWVTPMASSANYNISASVNTGFYYQWENFINFNKTWGKHNVGAMAGMSYIENNYDNASISAQGPDILAETAENFRYIDYLKSDVNPNRSNAPGLRMKSSHFTQF